MQKAWTQEEGRAVLEGTIGIAGKDGILWQSGLGWGKREGPVDDAAGKYLGREDGVGKVSSDRMNLVSTTGQASKIQESGGWENPH